MKKLARIALLTVSVLLAGVAENLTWDGMMPGVNMQTRAALSQATTTGDPCAQFQKASVSVQISSATTTKLVAAVTGAAIYVCSWQIEHPGGTGTMALEYGTKVSTDCDTGTTVIRAAFAYATSAGTATIDSWPPTNITGLVVPTSNELCALSTGSIVQVVTVSYVQR